ncbi:MAG TPA: LacI family DNA-binding transcriptional regulator [Thermoanaerobaculaceae bacterium]|nr:LacI family DNA-binding transcriptional regulator [Thermoanaerobaculaceae bacterium]
MPPRSPKLAAPAGPDGHGPTNVTIKHVAQEAGVSVATVSRVLNGKGPVSEATRRRIHQVAERMRYTPHGAARSLITRKTGAIGVFLPDIHGEFFSELIRGIDVASRRCGYHLLVSGSHGDKGELEAVLRATRGRVDGLIVMSPDVDAETLRANLPETLPVVLLNCGTEGLWFDSITIDNHGGAHAMVRHLIGLGHRRIALVNGPPRNFDARERQRGYRDALRERPGDWSAELEFEGDFSEEAGYRAGIRILDLAPRPTAVFAANDGMAIGVLSAVRDAGLRVPEDISLAGFDDIPISRFTAPPLSSVRVPIADLGAHAITRLLSTIAAGTAHDRLHERLATTPVLRQSCAPPGAGTHGGRGAVAGGASRTTAAHQLATLVPANAGRPKAGRGPTRGSSKRNGSKAGRRGAPAGRAS